MSPASRGALRFSTLLGLVASLLLSAVFFVSVWTKALDPAGFSQQLVRDYGTPAALASTTALLVIGLEAAVAFGLLGARRLPVLALATVMMAGFFGLSAYQYFYPPEDPSSCGCFGNLIQQSPLQHMLSNALFTALAALSWLALDRNPRFPGWRWAFPASGFLLAVAFSLAAPSLPIDNLATRLHVGTEVAEWRIDEIIPELQDGESLVLLIDRADEQTRLDIARVNELLAMNPDSPVQVFGLAEENEELATEFFWTAGPAFDVRGAPWGVIKPLYRHLPRSFLVKDGKVTRIWEGIPDEADLQALADGSMP